MKIVIVESKEREGAGSRIAVIVPDADLWAFEVLCARAGQEVLSITDEEKAQRKAGVAT